MFVKLDGRQVLVVGAGRVGEPKIRGLLATGARVHVVTLEANEAVREWARNGEIVLEERGFVLSDLDNVFLVVVATSSRELNELIFSEAQARRILCNVVDVPEQCGGDFDVRAGAVPRPKAAATTGTAVRAGRRALGRGAGRDSTKSSSQQPRSGAQTISIAIAGKRRGVRSHTRRRLEDE
jgi:hypothetical protein